MRAAWLASQPAPNPDTTQHGKIGIEEGQQVAPKGEEGSAAGSVKLEQQQQQQSDGRPTEGAAGEDAATGSSCGGCCSGILRWQLKQQQPGSNTGFVDHLLVSWSYCANRSTRQLEHMLARCHGASHSKRLLAS